MAGFYLEARSEEGCAGGNTLKIVDLGSPDISGTFAATGVRVAWTRWKNSAQLHVDRRPERFLWTEGQPDRLPQAGEAIEHWLPGRWGSFRGFEILTPADSASKPRIRVYVDPLGTRPVYCLASAGCLAFSDKLATLIVNFREKVAVDWPALLESLTVGVLYSAGTTIEGAWQLEPGEIVEVEGGRIARRARHRLPADPDVEPDAVRRDPSGTMRSALRKAVEETWTSTDTWLLLSGGLDSRFTLALAGPGRKTLTVTTRENAESRVARRIAACCGAEFRHDLRPVEHYHGVLRRSYLLTACAWEPWEAHHLGLGTPWRGQGIRGVVHAYLYDAVIKGNRIFPHQRFVSRSTPLYGVMSDRALCYAHIRAFRPNPASSELILGMLSTQARELVDQRLRRLAESLDPVISDGLELTAERRLFECVSKGHSYPQLLSWMEEQDVSTPIFHPALWSWVAASRPADRFRGRAFRDALLGFDHPATRVIDSNTGKPIRAAHGDFRGRFRNQSWYPLLRDAAARVRGARVGKPRPAPPDERAWPPLGPVFRMEEGRRIVEEGLNLVPREWVDGQALDAVLESFASGEDRYLETILGWSAVGRWVGLVRDGAGFAGPEVYEVTIEAAAQRR